MPASQRQQEATITSRTGEASGQVVCIGNGSQTRAVPLGQDTATATHGLEAELVTSFAGPSAK